MLQDTLSLLVRRHVSRTRGVRARDEGARCHVWEPAWLRKAMNRGADIRARHTGRLGATGVRVGPQPSAVRLRSGRRLAAQLRSVSSRVGQFRGPAGHIFMPELMRCGSHCQLTVVAIEASTRFDGRALDLRCVPTVSAYEQLLQDAAQIENRSTLPRVHR